MLSKFFQVHLSYPQTSGQTSPHIFLELSKVQGARRRKVVGAWPLHFHILPGGPEVTCVDIANSLLEIPVTLPNWMGHNLTFQINIAETLADASYHHHDFSCLIPALHELIISCMTSILKHLEVCTLKTPANIHRYPNLEVIHDI